MKLKIRKSLRRKYSNTKRRTRRRQKGSSQNTNTIFSVDYNSIRVISGQQLTKKQTYSQPIIKFIGESGKLYTLIMWDPDVPPQIQPGFAHWIVTNLKSSNDIQNNQLLEYKGPSPPSGTHRYYFGLFEQKGHINPQQPERQMFDVNRFISENNLTRVYEVFMKVSSRNV